MEDNKIRIIAAIVDTMQLTMYKENGTTITIPQGDPRLRTILEVATPQLVEYGYADIAEDTLAAKNDYLEFEQKSNGVVRLFRVAKEKLSSLFALGIAEEVVDIVPPTTIGNLATVNRLVEHNQPSTRLEKVQHAVDEILAHAIPVSSPEFTEHGIAQQNVIVDDNGVTPNAHPNMSERDTVIAVVGDKIIPGVELIKTQFTRAAKLGSTIGVENFLKRLGAVIHERKHSIEDLLKFLERADLPIADDGSILIYKLLRRQDKQYVDCHTMKVNQWVGAYVHMDIRLVDHDRRNECSNGLHVARRGYLSSFSGDVCVLAKLAPEDVIAVPLYDANKMRVCGYHIIKELSPEQFQLVKSNRPITEDPDGKILLAEAIAGHHIGRTHSVKITEQRGGGVETTVLQQTKEEREKVEIKPVDALENADKESKDIPVDVKALSQQVGQMSRADKAKKLYQDYLDKDAANRPSALEALKAFKKASKVSWDKLGIPDPDSVPAPSKSAPKKPRPVKDETPKLIQEIEISEGSARERIQKLMQLELNKQVAQSILNVKRQAKKSWEVLGVDAAMASEVVRIAG
jgi:hypothetical protein